MSKVRKPKHFYMKFDVGAWLKDPTVTALSSSSRGIWFDLLCAMHEDDQCGRLTGSYESLARLARCSVAELRASLAEIKLQKTGNVTFRDGLVTVTNRKMRRGYEDRIAARVRKKKSRGKQGLSRPCHNTLYAPSESESESSILISKSDTDGDAALRKVSEADLRDIGRLLVWIAEAVVAGLLTGSEEETIRVVAMSRRCLAKGKRPVNLFRSMVRDGKWDHIAETDYDAASAALREHRRSQSASRYAPSLQRTEAE